MPLNATVYKVNDLDQYNKDIDLINKELTKINSKEKL